jgi:hypothetical protein
MRGARGRRPGDAADVAAGHCHAAAESY